MVASTRALKQASLPVPANGLRKRSLFLLEFGEKPPACPENKYCGTASGKHSTIPMGRINHFVFHLAALCRKSCREVWTVNSSKHGK